MDMLDVQPWSTVKIEFTDYNSVEIRWDIDSAGFQSGTLWIYGGSRGSKATPCSSSPTLPCAWFPPHCKTQMGRYQGLLNPPQ